MLFTFLVTCTFRFCRPGSLTVAFIFRKSFWSWNSWPERQHKSGFFFPALGCASKTRTWFFNFTLAPFCEFPGDRSVVCIWSMHSRIVFMGKGFWASRASGTKFAIFPSSPINVLRMAEAAMEALCLENFFKALTFSGITTLGFHLLPRMKTFGILSYARRSASRHKPKWERCWNFGFLEIFSKIRRLFEVNSLSRSPTTLLIFFALLLFWSILMWFLGAARILIKEQRCPPMCKSCCFSWFSKVEARITGRAEAIAWCNSDVKDWKRLNSYFSSSSLASLKV